MVDPNASFVGQNGRLNLQTISHYIAYTGVEYEYITVFKMGYI